MPPLWRANMSGLSVGPRWTWARQCGDARAKRPQSRWCHRASVTPPRLDPCCLVRCGQNGSTPFMQRLPCPLWASTQPEAPRQQSALIFLRTCSNVEHMMWEAGITRNMRERMWRSSRGRRWDHVEQPERRRSRCFHPPRPVFVFCHAFEFASMATKQACAMLTSVPGLRRSYDER